jgi:hypothetical protein
MTTLRIATALATVGALVVVFAPGFSADFALAVIACI